MMVTSAFSGWQRRRTPRQAPLDRLGASLRRAQEGPLRQAPRQAQEGPQDAAQDKGSGRRLRARSGCRVGQVQGGRLPVRLVCGSLSGGIVVIDVDDGVSAVAVDPFLSMAHEVRAGTARGDGGIVADAVSEAGISIHDCFSLTQPSL